MIAAVIITAVTLSTIVAMGIGIVIPALTAFITKENLPAHVKVLILLLLSTIAGAVSSLAGNLPTSGSDWAHLALNVLLTFATAAASDVAVWEKSGALAAIHRKTKDFGIGPSTKAA